MLRAVMAGLALFVLIAVFIWEPAERTDIRESLIENNPVPNTTKSQVKPSPLAPFENMVKDQANLAASTTVTQYMNLAKRVNNEIFLDPPGKKLFLQSEQSVLEGDQLYYAGDFEAAQEQYEAARKKIAGLSHRQRRPSVSKSKRL